MNSIRYYILTAYTVITFLNFSRHVYKLIIHCLQFANLQLVQTTWKTTSRKQNMTKLMTTTRNGKTVPLMTSSLTTPMLKNNRKMNKNSCNQHVLISGEHSVWDEQFTWKQRIPRYGDRLRVTNNPWVSEWVEFNAPLTNNPCRSMCT